jgi:hypothetical protein
MDPDGREMEMQRRWGVRIILQEYEESWSCELDSLTKV